ncbi:MAG: tetratricopeptide repeat protein [Hyphomicrobiaceae bacterium]
MAGALPVVTAGLVLAAVLAGSLPAKAEWPRDNGWQTAAGEAGEPDAGAVEALPDPEAGDVPGLIGPNGERPVGRPRLKGDGGVAAKPAAPIDRATLLDDLFARLKVAPTSETAAPLVEAIDRLMFASGSDTVDLLMTNAMIALAEVTPAGDDRDTIPAPAPDGEEATPTPDGAGDSAAVARQILDSVLMLAPHYAEGWHRRAVLQFRQKRYGEAIGDLNQALALEPRNFHALEGLGRLLQTIGRKELALDALRRSLAIYPANEDLRTVVDALAREVEGEPI